MQFLFFKFFGTIEDSNFIEFNFLKNFTFQHFIFIVLMVFNHFFSLSIKQQKTGFCPGGE